MSRERDSMTVQTERIIDMYRENHEGELPEPDWVTHTLLELHPELVEDWFERKRFTLLRTYAVAKVLNAMRKRIISQIQRGLRQGDWGEAGSMDVFIAPVYVAGVGWRTLGKMTGEDFKKVERYYAQTEETMGRRKVMYGELAERTGDKMVKEVFKPDELIDILRTGYGDNIPRRLGT